MASPLLRRHEAPLPPQKFNWCPAPGIGNDMGQDTMTTHGGLWKAVNIPLLTLSHVNLICYLAA